MNQNAVSLTMACVMLLAGGATAMAESELPKLERSELSRLRKEEANRPRRILYNDDGCDDHPYTTPEELISLRVRQVANTQVDTICYCTGGGGLFWAHQPKVGEVLGEWIEEGHEAYVKQMRDGLVALKELGTDPLAVVVDYAHTNRMEVFWSYRMNNPECSYVSWGLSRRKREHPEYLMGDKSQWDPAQQTNPRTWWSLWDFERPEVRDYIVRIFEDVCQRYDIDGIELDFIRHPLFFRPNLDGLPAEPKHVAMLTDMVHRIREVTDRESMKRGRPIVVSVRAPLSIQSCMDIGLDIRAYLEEDLMDILIAGQDYVQMAVSSSLKDMVDLGHEYRVPVYALLVPAKPYALYMHDNRAWWGAAMNRFHWGADGIYLFNLFPAEPNELFGQLGSVESLKGRDKIYAIDNPARESVLGTFKMVMVAPDRLPLALVPGESVTAKLPVGEDIVANAPAGTSASALLRIGLVNIGQGDNILIRLNGVAQELSGPVEPLIDIPNATWFCIDVDPQRVQPGHNLIDLQLVPNRTVEDQVQLDFLDLVVTYS